MLIEEKTKYCSCNDYHDYFNDVDWKIFILMTMMIIYIYYDCRNVDYIIMITTQHS
jgi:hypothetical protein